MAPPEAIAMGSVVGARVGTHDVFHWERIFANVMQCCFQRLKPENFSRQPEHSDRQTGMYVFHRNNVEMESRRCHGSLNSKAHKGVKLSHIGRIDR
jgi:hypothetical protein